jgi:acyl dehydratase
MPGKHFEDFRRGQRWETPFHRVTKKEIATFARLSGDKNPLHLDPIFTKTTSFKTPIAHGLLGLSLASGMLDRLGIIRKTVVAFVGLEWRFTAPIYPGDRIRLKLRVVRKKKTSRPERGVIVFGAEVVNQNDRVVQEGKWAMLVRTKAVNF